MLWPSGDPSNDPNNLLSTDRFWVQAVRLPRSGSLTGEGFATQETSTSLTTGGMAAFNSYAAAIAPGGTAKGR